VGRFPKTNFQPAADDSNAMLRGLRRL
jgi:hypothetical protein